MSKYRVQEILGGLQMLHASLRSEEEPRQTGGAIAVRSTKPLIEIYGLSKMYRIFRQPRYRIMDLLGLPVRRDAYNEFWALRDIELTVAAGERLGIIGRNGAGKSTLLKIVAGVLQPSTGTAVVRGQVQALMELGTGFHPEFTGRQNVHAALSYRGITGAAARQRFEEIVEFTELEAFIDHPLKTYSTGMYARLAFAVATSIEPEILIIDEVLGAGDAYFFGKSTERMRQLVDSGASILLVSHGLDQITRFCERAVWLDRGRMVQSGPSLEVVKAYQQYIQLLEERRLQAKNRKTRSQLYSTAQYDNYGDTVIVRFTLSGPPLASGAIAELSLWKNDTLEERLLVGHAQDTDTSQAAFVRLEGSTWSTPCEVMQLFCRSLELRQEVVTTPSGEVVFNLYAFFDDADYAIEVRYCCSETGQLGMAVVKNGIPYDEHVLPASPTTWTTQRLPLRGGATTSASALDTPLAAESEVMERMQPASLAVARTERRWPGAGSLRIERVVLLDANDREQTVFPVGSVLTLSLRLLAQQSGCFPVIPVAVLYRLDGLVVSRHVGPTAVLELRPGDRREARIVFQPLNLGNGNYVFSVAIYKTLVSTSEGEFYDLIDRSYEFQVVGNPPLEDGIFHHPGVWSVV